MWLGMAQWTSEADHPRPQHPVAGKLSISSWVLTCCFIYTDYYLTVNFFFEIWYLYFDLLVIHVLLDRHPTLKKLTKSHT